MLLAATVLLAAGLQPRPALVEIGLNVDDPELAVLFFAVRAHGPEERDVVAGNGNVGVISGRHQHGVSFTNRDHELGIVGIGIDKLQTVGGSGHVDVHVHFLEHLGVLVAASSSSFPARRS